MQLFRLISFSWLVLAGHTGNPDQKLSSLREVEIIGTDYAFQIPPDIAAGPVVFRFTNDGNARHELNISLLKPGATAEQMLRLLKADSTVRSVIDGPVGVLFAGRHNKSTAGLSTNLLPGRDYMVLCVSRDSAGRPKHYDLGMYALLHVTASKSQEGALIPADTIVAMDYAFRYRGVLASGRHRFVMINAGKQRHEVSMGLLKKGVTTEQLVEADKAGKKINMLFDAHIGVLHSYGGTAPLGSLEVDLLPGREYYIECGFQDDQKAAPHYQLGMYGSIHVNDSAPN